MGVAAIAGAGVQGGPEKNHQPAASATTAAAARTAGRDQTVQLGREKRIRRRALRGARWFAVAGRRFAFPARDDGGGDAVARHVHAGADRIEQRVDAE